MGSKAIVCLANSRKNSGRCIAGKEISAGGYGAWIRPVSTRPSGELSEEDRRYEDGTEPRLLDIIEICLIGAYPTLYQSENYAIDQNYHWIKTGNLPWSKLAHLTDNPDTLWLNNDSTYYGQNDKISFDDASTLKNSLYLITPQSLFLHVGKGAMEQKRRVRAHFSYKNTQYILIVTDPHAEQFFLAKPDDNYQIQESLLCISLGENFHGSCYKLVAAIVAQELLHDHA